MSNNHFETNYSKQYKIKLAQKEQTIHTISVEIQKNTNTLYNNYQNNNNLKITNLSNNKLINTRKNKIFKNIKLYGFSKQINGMNKRNIKTKKINSIPHVSFTEINTNIKKTFSSNFKGNNTPINNNNNLTNINNTIILYHKNYY